MTIREEIADALEELESDLQDHAGATQKLTLPAGAELPCVPSMERVWNKVANAGPQIEDIDTTVIVRKSHFITADLTNITVDLTTLTADNDTPRLRSGKKPTFRTKTYRVVFVEEDPSGAYFKVYLRSAK
jgi:hypothetical protein